MSRWFRAASGLALVAATGCAPMISHGPDVRPGVSAGVSASLGRGPTYESGDDPGPFYLGTLAANAAYGWRPAEGRAPAVRLGVAAPFMGGAGADLYVQAPPAWTGSAAVGAGVFTAFPDGFAMPYVQAGVEGERGFGFHVLHGRYETGRRQMSGYSHEERAGVTWLSAQVPFASGATLHLHAGYAKGHVTRTWDRDQEPYIDEDRWVRLGGITLELHHPRK